MIFNLSWTPLITLFLVITGIWREGVKFRETAVIQNRMHLSQRSSSIFLVRSTTTHIHMPLLHSPAMPCTSPHPRWRRRGLGYGWMSNRSHHTSLIRLGIQPVMMRLEILSIHITFNSNSDFIILHIILMPLSLSLSCRRPVPLQEGPLAARAEGGAGGGSDARPSRPGAGGVGREGWGRHHLARRWGDVADRELGIAGAGRAERGFVGHTSSKTSRLQPARKWLICQARLCTRVYSHWNLSWFHIRNYVIHHLTSQVGWLWYHSHYHDLNHIWYHRPMIS
jgi:hypothetical protein